MRSQRYGQVRAVPFGTTTALASGEAARVALRSAAEGPGRLAYDRPTLGNGISARTAEAFTPANF
jgi:hypothetical protein